MGLLPFLLLCIGGGFLALLTPCSFPMVPITVSFFLKQSELQHKRPWLLALVYCGSIVAAFTVLGVGIAAIFGVSQLNALCREQGLYHNGTRHLSRSHLRLGETRPLILGSAVTEDNVVFAVDLTLKSRAEASNRSSPTVVPAA